MCLFLGGSLSFTLGSSCFILEQTNIFSNGSKAVQLSALYHVIGISSQMELMLQGLMWLGGLILEDMNIFWCKGVMVVFVVFFSCFKVVAPQRN